MAMIGPGCMALAIMAGVMMGDAVIFDLTGSGWMTGCGFCGVGSISFSVFLAFVAVVVRLRAAVALLMALRGVSFVAFVCSQHCALVFNGFSFVPGFYSF